MQTIPTYQRYSRVDSRKHFFDERIVQPWNSLPAKNQHFKSFVILKLFIKKVNLTNFTSLGF